MNRITRPIEVLLPLAALLLLGCGQSSNESDSPVNPLFAERKPGDPPKTGVLRKAEEPIIQNDLRNIALFYNEYVNTYRKPPQKLEDFTSFIQKDDANLKRAIENQKYIIVLKVPLNSGRVIAYEQGGDINGNHFVVKSDGAAHDIPDSEMQKLLKEISGN